MSTSFFQEMFSSAMNAVPSDYIREMHTFLESNHEHITVMRSRAQGKSYLSRILFGEPSVPTIIEEGSAIVDRESARISSMLSDTIHNQCSCYDEVDMYRNREDAASMWRTIRLIEQDTTTNWRANDLELHHLPIQGRRVREEKVKPNGMVYYE